MSIHCKAFVVPTVGSSTFFHIKSILVQTKPYILLRYVQFICLNFVAGLKELGYFCSFRQHPFIVNLLLQEKDCCTNKLMFC